MCATFLSDIEFVSIGAMLSATGWNLKKMMKDLAKKSTKTLFVLLQSSLEALDINYCLLEKSGC